MPFHMRRPVGVADVPSLCAVYFSAFADTTIGRRVFPPTSEAAKQFWIESLTKDLENPNFEFLVMTNRPPSSSPEEEEEIIAYAKWVRPGTPVKMPPPVDAWPQDGNPALAVEFFGTLAASHKRIMEHRPHWYLDLIGVRKEWMGKGAASALMRWGVDRADEDGLPCFLEATPNGRGMYEKYGFRVVEEQEFDSPYGRALDFYMVRDAKAGAK
ncbi:acyl-CoA N-acyltransferase [Thelonectria olida]|uniref:Acyl-CoA N-acyltransferase n=1 Tax=Thelonectria olida TaxID=1576542 RepID=A0A9P9AUS7_9HYPO|nr:acyl-CoA N-acyltransferase [Thelonectria olida]